MENDLTVSQETWFNSRWRPAMAWLWFTVSAFDFIVFPILSALAAGAKIIPYTPWQPLTLQGGGLFHLAMGGVVGVAAWRRTDEKMAVFAANGTGGTVTSETSTTSSVSVQPKSPRAD